MASSSSISSWFFLGALAGLLLVSIVMPSSAAWGEYNSPVGGNHHRYYHAWESFRNLSGCQLGDQQPGLAQLKRYLHHLGYLGPAAASSDVAENFTDVFDHELESALVAYQNFFNLDVNGRLDAPTLGLITTPRCGVPDVIDGGRRRSLYEFFFGTWLPKRHLRYTFKSTAGFPAGEVTVSAIFARAFATWSNSTRLDFKKTAKLNDSSAEISIRFEYIDGPFQVAGKAWFPPDGILIMDDAEDWIVSPKSGGQVDMEAVALHEIGHTLGLQHSPDRKAVMFPTVFNFKVRLGDDDVTNIQLLYGTR